MTTETKPKPTITTFRLTPFYGISQIEGTASAQCLFNSVLQFIKDNKSIINKDAEFSVIKIETNSKDTQKTLRDSTGVIATDANFNSILEAMKQISATACDICIQTDFKHVVCAWSTNNFMFREFVATLTH